MYIYHVTEMKLIFVKTVFWGFELQSCKLKVNILAYLIVLIRWNTLPNPTFFFITVAPEVTIDGGEQQFVVVGNEIQLTCHYNTSPPVSEVSWEKDGIVISRNGSVVVGARTNITHFNDSTVQLTLVQSILSDSGNYTCVVTNRIDNSSATASVIIQGQLEQFIYFPKRVFICSCKDIWQTNSRTQRNNFKQIFKNISFESLKLHRQCRKRLSNLTILLVWNKDTSVRYQSHCDTHPHLL